MRISSRVRTQLTVVYAWAIWVCLLIWAALHFHNPSIPDWTVLYTLAGLLILVERFKIPVSDEDCINLESIYLIGFSLTYSIGITAWAGLIYALVSAFRYPRRKYVQVMNAAGLVSCALVAKWTISLFGVPNGVVTLTQLLPLSTYATVYFVANIGFVAVYFLILRGPSGMIQVPPLLATRVTVLYGVDMLFGAMLSVVLRDTGLAGAILFAGLSMLISYSYREYFEMAHHFADLAIRDELTGLYNHRHAHSLMDKLIASNHQFALLMVDIDHFRRYNEIWGHVQGDEALKFIANILHDNALRPVAVEEGTSSAGSTQTAADASDNPPHDLQPSAQTGTQLANSQAAPALEAGGQRATFTMSAPQTAGSERPASDAPISERANAAALAPADTSDRASNNTSTQSVEVPTATPVSEDAAIQEVARYSGEEFVLILPDYSLELAQLKAEALRKAIEDAEIPGTEKLPGRRFTVSIGVAGFPEMAKNKQELLTMVDDALYKGKFTGRNKVSLYTSVIDEMKQGLELNDVDQEIIKTIKVFLAILNSKDRYTYAHTERDVRYAEALGKRVGLAPQPLQYLRFGAFLHDIGKVEIPLEVLTKRGPLSREEWVVMKSHVEIGANIARPIPSLAPCLPIIRHHHERYDGTGYPDGLAGEDIPLEARILTIADSFDAMTTSRPYQRKRSMEEAFVELRACAGKQFDPNLVEPFIAAVREIGLIAEEADEQGLA